MEMCNAMPVNYTKVCKISKLTSLTENLQIWIDIQLKLANPDRYNFRLFNDL